MTESKLTGAALLLSLALTLPAAAQDAAMTKRSFTVADVNRIVDVSEPALSPDGATVVYTVSRHNLEIDQTVTDIWTVPYEGGDASPLTKTKKASEWSPEFSPDGSLVAYLSDRAEDGSVQIWTMRPDGRRHRQITEIEGGVVEFSWSPDSRKIVFVADIGAAKTPDTDVPPPIVIDRYQFKEDGRDYLTTNRLHMHVLDLDTGDVEQISEGPFDHWFPRWSPDGKWIAYVSKITGDPDRNMNFDVFIKAPKKDAKARQISTFEGTDIDPYWGSAPEWSPDSRKLVWLQSGEDKWIYYAPWQLVVGDIETGEITKPAQLDRCVYLPRWSADGKSIYALIEQPEVTHLARIDLATEEVVYLAQGDRFAFDFAITADDKIALLDSSDLLPFEIFAVHGNRQERITDHNPWLAGVELAQAEPFTFKSEGLDIHGLLVQPFGHSGDTPPPAILRIHGGPVYQFSREFMYDWQVYAANGYAVVAINPRGSSGRGFDFSRAIYADWGNVDARDLLAGINYLVTTGAVDGTRLGIGGWSYGSMLTNYVIAQDTRFRAAVSGAGTANMFGTYAHDQYVREYEFELGRPWEDFEAYRRVSFPFLNANRIKTPTLFQCASRDFNVPCLGSEQMYQALKSLNVDTRLIIYPGENHGLSVPSYLRDRMQRNLDWYNTYLAE